MNRRYRFGSKSRDDLWARDSFAAYTAGRGRRPICPHCDLPVSALAPWDRCHVGAPRYAGGTTLAVGHRVCNQLHNAKVDTPAFAKSNRVRANHLGIRGPGLGKYPMRAGRRSPIKKTFRHGPQPRLTHGQLHARLLASRAIIQAEASP